MVSLVSKGWAIFALVCLTSVMWGCPADDVSDTKENNRKNPAVCPTTCDAGQMRCADGSVEACAVGVDGCFDWKAGQNCTIAGLTCDDSVQPATCITEAGTCTDAKKNQDETDVDCGGVRCNACAFDKSCAQDADCQSLNCDKATFTCKMPLQAGTCVDGIKNQDETDADCGGSTCPACPVDKECTRNEDCATSTCNTATNKCVEPMQNPTCSDSVKNQDETDTDCGGAACPDCALGKLCTTNTDCATNYCDAVSKKCENPPVAETCNDNIKNQDETDVDCGGTKCSACLEMKACTQASDCQSSNCDVGKSDKCVAVNVATCADGIKNQDESDLDCGGSCPACNIGQQCQRPSDCSNMICDFTSTGTCINANPRYEVNEDFETGDLSLFPYELNSNQDPSNHWTIETTAANCHMGSFCMRTNPAQQLLETTTNEVSLSVRENTNITFFAKVNTESMKHFFRFYIDGQQVLELSGQHAWQQYSFPVMATGPNGPNRVFKWEFERSDFVDPNHVPWMEVWIDDIDFPDWNTEPTTPETIRPWNGTVTTDRQPTFQWRSFDPDFDPITYELEWDKDPMFSNPDTTGETNDLQFKPSTMLDDQSIYYWRVRAKDNSNFRWSQWSQTWAVAIDSTQQLSDIWRQSVAAQFNQNDLGGVKLVGDIVQREPQDVSLTSAYAAVRRSVTFNVPVVAPGTPGTITVNLHGDFDSSTEFATVSLEGTVLGTVTGGCYASKAFTVNDMSPYAADGVVTISLTASPAVNNGGCATSDRAEVKFQMLDSGEGIMTSVPINFSTFNNRKYWEKLQVVGTGDISLQVLDGQGALLPDSVVPNNMAGNTSRTLHLWGVDPATYPVIRLRAFLKRGASIEEWSVIGNDVFEWVFDHDTDAEGWIAQDRNATPTINVAGGVLRFETQEAGNDPRIEYVFPQPVDASRFTTVEVRLRTSNNYTNDDITFHWQSNFGGFDDRRSFVSPNIFLQAFQDISFDLTTMPMMPNQPWQGQIEAIRIDPVVDFYGQAMMPPTQLWVEVDRIAIY